MKFRVEYRHGSAVLTGRSRITVGWFGFLRCDVQIETDGGELLWKRATTLDLAFLGSFK